MPNILEKPELQYILLACCTCQRPNMLENMLVSVNSLLLPENINVEILIVDNDSEQTAKSVCEKMQGKLKIKMHYVVENNRGLANARNRVLEEAINFNASHIFMFDDDELLTPDALIEHINLYSNNENCFISSGIVINKFDEKVPRYIKKNLIFKQKTTKKTGQIRKSCASGNVFFPVEMLKSNDNLRFSKEYIYMGGEDGAFFKEASELGYTIVQNTDSLIYESVTSARANLKYILKRAYYNGYSGSYLKFKQTGLKKKNSLLYEMKLLLVLLLNAICLLPSILLGRCIFVNVLSMLAKTAGKFQGARKKVPMEFYKKVYGE